MIAKEIFDEPAQLDHRAVVDPHAHGRLEIRSREDGEGAESLPRPPAHGRRIAGRGRKDGPRIERDHAAAVGDPFDGLPVDMGREAEDGRQAELEEVEQVFEPRTGPVQPLEHLDEEVEHGRVLLFLLQQGVDELDRAQAVGEALETSREAVKGAHVAALAERLDAARSLVVEDDLRVRHRLKGRPEPALRPARTPGHHRQLALSAREERDDLARLAVVDASEDDGLGAHDHGRGASRLCRRLGSCLEYKKCCG